MSKKSWSFRPTALQRAFRTIQAMGFKPRAVAFPADGGFKILIDDPEELTDHLASTETSETLRKLIS
jgi:hypothetical protein